MWISHTIATENYPDLFKKKSPGNTWKYQVYRSKINKLSQNKDLFHFPFLWSNVLNTCLQMLLPKMPHKKGVSRSYITHPNKNIKTHFIAGGRPALISERRLWLFLQPCWLNNEWNPFKKNYCFHRFRVSPQSNLMPQTRQHHLQNKRQQ